MFARNATVMPCIVVEKDGRSGLHIVRGVSYVLLGSTEAALMENFTPISRRPAKCAMTSPWIHSGARSAPLCTQAILMAHFAGQREIRVKFPMRAASVDPKKQKKVVSALKPIPFD